MAIEGLGLPRAGQAFRFTVSGTSERTAIEAYIGTKRVLQAECPDPPCHEVVPIPEDARGLILRIVATDSSSNRIEQEFRIGDSEASSGGMMTSSRTAH
jgi:hypothetical protein